MANMWFQFASLGFNITIQDGTLKDCDYAEEGLII